jgi:DNA excision repair protein ERCC-2
MGTAMASSIQCTKCSRVYTVDEYEEDRFCRDCKTLLRLVPSSESRKNWRDLFPYEPYPPQVEFIEDVQKTVARGGVLIAEACNGFGKTISTLSCLLPTGKQIIYATRTHEQVRQVLLELKTINEKSGEKYSAVNLASRDFLCINPECRGLPSNEAQEECHRLRKEGECPYTHEIEKPPNSLPIILGRKELIEEGRRRKLCPYFLSRRMAQESNVIVAPYPYIFNPMIRLMTGLDLNKKILILDEGHNIDQVGQEILSDTLTERGLSAAAEELKLIGKSPRYIQRLGEHLLKTDADKPRLVQPQILEEELEKALRTDLHTFIEGHAPLVDAIRAKKIQNSNPPVCNLNGLLEYLELIQTSQKNKYVGLYTKNYYGAPVIEYRCLDPSLAVEPVVKEADGVLIMSGTLSPIDTFAEIIGQEKAEKRVYPPIQKSDKIQMTIDSGISSAYRERTEQMITKMGKTISEDLEKVNQGALIFFTQRGFMTKCIEDWTRKGIIKNQNGFPYLGGKQLFREGRDAEQNREVVSRYKQMAVSSGGAVLCCVFRGRNSEGSNFPEDQARGIFLVGVPYANYGDPLVKAQMSYFDKQKKGLGNKWYTMDAFRAANQSLGRGIRGRDDWCHYWMLDRRYYENRNLISKWAMGEKPIIRKTASQAQSTFKKFKDDTIIEL